MKCNRWVWWFLAMVVALGSLAALPSGRAIAAPQKALFVIPAKNFRDEEYKYPRQILEQGGVKVTVASTTLKPVKGMLGMVVKPDIPLSKAQADPYVAIVFIGGSGAKQYWDDPVAHRLARQAVAQGKVLGANCIAPVTLAKAGVLKGKRATVWGGVKGMIIRYGAKYVGPGVVRDGKIITASDPAQAKPFGIALMKAIKGK